MKKYRLGGVVVAFGLIIGSTSPAVAVDTYPGVSNVQITATGQSSGGLKVTWANPSNPTFNADFGGFEVRVKNQNDEIVSAQVIESESSTEALVSGLINGTQYTAEVATRYGGAPNDKLARSNGSAAPYDVPSAPAKPILARSNSGELTVSWLTPADNGNAVSGYKVSCNPACPLGEMTSSALQLVISGLTTSTAYTVTVVATNERGDSAASVSSDSVKPHASVVAPTTLSVTPGDSQVIASWVAPSISGATISSYSVQLFKETDPGTVLATRSVTGTSATFTGLTNGLKYFFKVSTVVGSITSAPATSLLGLTAATVVSQPPAQVVTGPASSAPNSGSVGASTPSAPTLPKLAPKQKAAGSALATQIGMTITPKAKIKLTVAKSSKAFCKVSGGKLVALKPGNCAVTISVTPAKSKLVKKPKTVKRVTFVSIS